MALTYNVTSVFSEYFSYPVDVAVKINNKANQEFPAVTVCNVNPIRKSAWNAFRSKRQKRNVDRKANPQIYSSNKIDEMGTHIPPEAQEINLKPTQTPSRNKRSVLGLYFGF